MSVQDQIDGRQGLATQKFLTASGDGLGTYNLIGNYSASPTDFYYKATSQYDIYSILIVICDNFTFYLSNYGTITDGITNGVKLFIKPNGANEIPLLSGIAIKKNYEFLSLNHETTIIEFDGMSQALMVNFNLLNDYGKPITLGIGDSFIVRLNDDFSSLVSHTFGIRGIKI